MILLAAAFVTFGLFWGGWAVSAADLERTLHVGHAGLGVMLMAVPAFAAAVGLFLQSRRRRRRAQAERSRPDRSTSDAAGSRST